VRRPLDEEGISLYCGRRTPQLKRNPLGSASYQMSSLSGVSAVKWLAAANLLAATGAFVVSVLQTLAFAFPSATEDIDAVGYAFLGLLVTLPTAALFGLAAAALWWRWPRRWLCQGLAILWPLLVLVLFFVSFRKATLPN
jgi:hypothetical protein